VRNLEVAWTYPLADATFHPLMAGGVFYGRASNAIVAIEAASGRPLWVHDGLNGMTTRGMNYWESEDGTDRRLIFSINDYLQQIDANTGRSIMTFGDGGVVDLRMGLDREPSTVTRSQSGTPGQIFENLIIIGSAPGEGYFSAHGPVRAYDVRTGALAWQFNSIPRPGEFGYDTWPPNAWQYIGATNAWGEISVDSEKGIVYVPTGSPTYDFYGADRPGINLFGNSLIAIDARTGRRLWHFQTTHHDVWDMDNAASPMLTTIRQNGRERDVVALATKTGFLFVFDRVTGEPIWPIEERPVPAGNMPGEYYHPTQPYPTAPPPFAPQRFTINDVNPYSNVTPEARAQFMERLQVALRGSDHIDLYSPIGLDWTMHIPGNNGGAVFGTTAAEPNSGMVYVVGQNNPSMLRLFPPNTQGGGGGGGGGGGAAAAAAAAALAAMPGATVYQRDCSTCHGADRAGTNLAPTLANASGRLDAATIKGIITNGRDRMPAMPHVMEAEQDQVVAYLLAASAPRPAGAPGPGGGAGGGGAATPPASPFPSELIVQTGPARTRTGERGPTMNAYPDGVEDYDLFSINGQYGTIGTMAKPPYTTITAYDLNAGTIRWQKGFGDDIELAAQGVRSTGSPQMRNSIVGTASGLLFGVGYDGKLRAWDSDTGEELWSHQLGAIGASTRGSPTLYEVDGRTYIVVSVPAAGGGGGGGGGGGNASPAMTAAREAIANLPKGYVAFALPE
jgi:quinoprotein glucose dehydrogenase